MKCDAIPSLKLSFVFYNIVLYSLKIIGLAPFTVRNRNSWGNNTQGNNRTQPFKFSKAGSVYNFILLIPILSGISIFFIVGAATDSGAVEFSISAYINESFLTLRNIVTFGTAVLVLIVWNLRQKKAVATLNLLFEVSARLSEFKKQTTDGWIVISFTIHFTITVVVWILAAVLAMDYTSFLKFVWSLLELLPLIVNFWFTVEYSMVVKYLVRQLKTVNKCLTNYQELSYPSRPSVRNNVCIVIDCNDHLASIRLLRSTRAKLLELCQEIADFFSLPILFVIFHSFIAFFTDVYVLFMTTYKPGERYASPMESGSPFLWTMLIFGVSVYPVVSLTLNVTRANQEVGLTGRILNKLLFTVRSGSPFRVELLQFSRELLHDSVDMFTAYGLFSLDSTLLPSMLASTATYFIILVQFRSPGAESELLRNCTVSA